ncbi:MAG: glycosyltransferase family 39 protein [Vicinamibacterales bacterium]
MTSRGDQGRVPPPATGWLARHRRRIAFGVVVAALLVRATYAVQMRDSPLLDLHRIEQLDMHTFEAWAARIADGDWLSAGVGVPMHPWHRDVARAYLASHATRRDGIGSAAAGLADTTTAGSTDAAEAAVWTRWLGGRQFYQDPLYAYAIALTYRLAGRAPRAVFVWQALLGAAGVLLIWDLTRRIFDDGTAAVAAALAILCGPLVYYDLVLLRASPMAFAGLAIAWGLERVGRHARTWPLVALGAGIGLATLLKATLALFAPVAVVAIAWRRRSGTGRIWSAGGHRVALGRAAALAAGVLAALVPLTVRNVSVGVAPFALSSQGPLVFAVANRPGYPEDAGFAVDAPQLAAVLGDADGRPWPVIRATLAAHTPASLLALAWQKIDRTLHWYEIPNNENFYLARRHAAVLGWLPVTGALLIPAGLVGLAFAWRDRRRAWPLYALVACAAAPLLIFYVLGRFRLPLLAALIPFAAVALVRIARGLGGRDASGVSASGLAARARGASGVTARGRGASGLTARGRRASSAASRRGAFRRALAGAAALVALAVWTNRPLPAGETTIRPTDWFLPYLARYQGDVREALARGDLAGAHAALEAFFATGPTAADLAATTTPDLGQSLARLHRQHAMILARLGRPAEAAREVAAAEALAPVPTR